MSGHIACNGSRKTNTKFQPENLKQRNYLGDIGVYGKNGF
jgi:hypothetical protein